MIAFDSATPVANLPSPEREATPVPRADSAGSLDAWEPETTLTPPPGPGMPPPFMPPLALPASLQGPEAPVPEASDAVRSAGALMLALRSDPTYEAALRATGDQILSNYVAAADYAVSEKPMPYLPWSRRARRKLSSVLRGDLMRAGLAAGGALRDLQQVLLTQHPEWDRDAVGQRMGDDLGLQLTGDARNTYVRHAMLAAYGSHVDFAVSVGYKSSGTWNFSVNVDLS